MESDAHTCMPGASPWRRRKAMGSHWLATCASPFDRLYRGVLRRVCPVRSKQLHELRYWKRQWRSEGCRFENAYYEPLMLAIAAEQDAGFVRDKVVADFGCGPKGSLCWARTAKSRIGIDVVADAYRRFGIADHNMRYVHSTETTIPLPSNCVDVLFTVNAMDHVSSFAVICRELLRILAPGGDLVGSINLDEPERRTEPQTLTEDLVQEHLLNRLEILSYRTAPRGPGDDTYRYLLAGDHPLATKTRILWVRARKPACPLR